MKMDAIGFESEMNRGFLQILILAVLEKPFYGYGMLKHFEEIGYPVEENTLYPLLRRLEKNGWINGQWEVSGERPRKVYRITTPGKAFRGKLFALWKEQNKILIRLLEDKSHA